MLSAALLVIVHLLVAASLSLTFKELAKPLAEQIKAMRFDAVLLFLLFNTLRKEFSVFFVFFH